MFIYRTQEGYRHVHVHPKPYRAYKITRIEIRFVFLVRETSDRRRIDGFLRREKCDGENRSAENAISSVSLSHSLSLPLSFSKISLSLSLSLLSVSLSHPLISLTITCYTDVIQLSIARVLLFSREASRSVQRAWLSSRLYKNNSLFPPHCRSAFLRLELRITRFTLIDRNEFLGYSFVRYRSPCVLIPSS